MGINIWHHIQATARDGIENRFRSAGAWSNPINLDAVTSGQNNYFAQAFVDLQVAAGAGERVLRNRNLLPHFDWRGLETDSGDEGDTGLIRCSNEIHIDEFDRLIMTFSKNRGSTKIVNFPHSFGLVFG
jgi:hypothetical protein